MDAEIKKAVAAAEALAEHSISMMEFDIKLLRFEAEFLKKLETGIWDLVSTINPDLVGSPIMFEKWADISLRYGALELENQRCITNRMDAIVKALERLTKRYSELGVGEDEWPELLSNYKDGS